MATLAFAPPVPDVDQRERRNFLALAALIAATVLAGFGGYAIVGISSFAAPWWVHVHALTYVGWIALYLAQNALVVRGDVARHRRLGRIMAGWALWMAVVGIALLAASLRSHRAPPPIFTAPFLVTMDGLTLVGFLALVAAGLALRTRSDWHRRLMLAATVCVIQPALGRVSVLAGGFNWAGLVIAQLAILALAALLDWRLRGRPHPALACGAAVIALIGIAVPRVAGLGTATAVTQALGG